MKSKTLRLSLMGLAAIMTLAVGGCRSKEPAAQTEQPAAVHKTTSLESRYTALTGSYGDWTDVRIPVNLKLRQPMSVSIGGTLTMRRDSALQLSLRFMGMEVLSAVATRDSVYASYRMDKVYIAESTRQLLGDFPATVGNLQSLLLGHVFVLGSPTPGTRGVTLAADGAGYTVTPEPAAELRGGSYSFGIGAAGTLTALTVTPGRGERPVVCHYALPSITPMGPVSTELSLKADLGRTTLEAALSLTPAKAQWNQGVNIKWRVPKGYRRVKAESLLKAIPSL